MKVAFVSGPYRAPTVWQITENIRAAARVALRYWKQGYAVICPHANAAHYDGEAADDLWLQGDLELLKRSDIVVMMQGWEKSAGARIERKEAIQRGLPIIYDDGGAS